MKKFRRGCVNCRKQKNLFPITKPLGRFPVLYNFYRKGMGILSSYVSFRILIERDD